MTSIFQSLSQHRARHLCATHDRPGSTPTRSPSALATACLAVVAGWSGAALAETAPPSPMPPADAAAPNEVPTAVVPSATASSPVELPSVKVQVKRAAESPSGPVRGYRATRSATATKTDTPLIETPQSTTVVGRPQMRDQGARNVAEALQYSAGVQGSNGANRTHDQLRVRGFGGAAESGVATFLDGSAANVNIYDLQYEPYGLERVELLRGAASVMAGQSAPGGVLNMVSKQPRADMPQELELEWGAFQRRQAAFDVGGLVSDGSDWTYRLTGLLRDAGTMVQHIDDDRTYLAPALRWQPSAATSLTLQGFYQRSKTRWNWGTPYQGAVLPREGGRLPTDLFTGEPGFDRWDSETGSIGYAFEHRFSDQWQFKQRVRAYENRLNWNSVYGTGLAEGSSTQLERFPIARNDRSKAFTADNQLHATWGSGTLQHQTLGGIDITTQKRRHQRYIGDSDETTALNVEAPQYGSFNVLVPESPTDGDVNHQRQIGIYLQDQIKWQDRWVLTLGGRQDHARSTGQLWSDGALAHRPAQNDKAFSGRAGLVYLAPQGWAPFVGYSESFEPAIERNFNGDAFRPKTGQQWEAGIRYQPPQSDLSLEWAAYEITQQNVTTTDPDHPDFNRQTGEVRSRGAELQATVPLSLNWQWMSSYAYTDAKITRSEDGDQGLRRTNVPRHAASTWVTYAAAPQTGRGWTVGAGVRGMDRKIAETREAEVPGYSVVDALVRYGWDRWQLSFNLNNALDRVYVSTCEYATSCFWGDRRQWSLNARYQF